MRHSKLFAAVLALCLAPGARADTVDVSSTTLVTGGQQTRFGTATNPSVVTVVPAFEILTLSARDVTNPISDDLRLVVSGWGSIELADRRWDNGTSSDLTGDLTTGYVQAGFLKRALTLRLGRSGISAGLGRMIQIDGGEVAYLLPVGVRLSAYVGAPVAQRFATRTGIRSWSPTPGDLAYGGRVAYTLSLPGAPGRGLDLGASVNMVQDGGDPVREEAGADLRLQLFRDVAITAMGAYAIYDEALSEANVALQFSPLHKLFVTADYRYVRPDLLLARNSILSVFSAANYNQVGAGVTYELSRSVSVGADYHLRIEPGETDASSNFLGNDAAVRADWRRGATLVGGEVFYLDALENGYTGGRLFGRQAFGKAFATADVLAHFFREQVNGFDYAVTGTLSGGYELPLGFAAVVSGRAGVTPYFEQTYDIMAKLVYNQSYTRREVR
jgi:hypothetical protein